MMLRARRDLIRLVAISAGSTNQNTTLDLRRLALGYKIVWVNFVSNCIIVAISKSNCPATDTCEVKRLWFLEASWMTPSPNFEPIRVRMSLRSCELACICFLGFWVATFAVTRCAIAHMNQYTFQSVFFSGTKVLAGKNWCGKNFLCTTKVAEPYWSQDKSMNLLMELDVFSL